jgi:hypothetical protein
MNINYPHASAESSKNDQIYSSSNTSQERSMPRYPQNHSEERYRQSNKSATSPLIRESSHSVEPRNTSHLTEPLEMSSELHGMLTKGSSSLQDSEIDDLDNPKHRYYLKVCYICKETTTKEHCIHYGALECFSCRAFFRRSHQGMQDKGLADDGKRKLPEFICKKIWKL